MADSKKNEAHKAVAASVKHKLPKALRDKVEVAEGGGAYSLIKLDGRTVASVRALIHCYLGCAKHSSCDAQGRAAMAQPGVTDPATPATV